MDLIAFSKESRSPTEAKRRPVLRPAPTDHDLTVIIPAYNEEKRLPWTLKQIVSFMDQWGVDYRLLVADDGSSDGTAALAEKFSPRCSTLRLTPQGGKGRAIRAGMLHATGRVLCFTDADLPFQLSAIKEGYRLITKGECEVVFGARDLPGAAHLAPRRLTRRLATFAFREIVRRLISREVTDTQCGLKLFSRRAAWEIFSRATIDGFAFDAEVVLLTHRLGLSFRRIPVTLVNELSSSLSVWRSALPMLCDVLRLWLRDRLRRTVPEPQVVLLMAEAEEHRAA